MSKRIEKVRKSIQHRKRKRLRTNQDEQINIGPSDLLMIEDEEKYGVGPFPARISEGERIRQPNKKLKISRALKVKFTCSLLFFFACTLILQTNLFENKAAAWTTRQLTENMPFAQLTNWYEQKFGLPLAFLDHKLQNTVHVSVMNQAGGLPVQGEIRVPYQQETKGILMKPDEQDIRTIQSGVVVFNGQTKETGKTIKVQHADGSETSYGNLAESYVHLYEYVQEGYTIGEHNYEQNGAHFFFAMKKDDVFIDPIEVERVDSQSDD